MGRRNTWRGGEEEILWMLEEALSEEVKVLYNRGERGGSLRVTVPARLARILGLRPGMTVRWILDPKRRVLILKPVDNP